MVHEDTCEQVVTTVSQLSSWSLEDVEAAARLQEVEEATQAFKQLFNLRPNMTPMELLQMMSDFANVGKRARA